MGGGRVVKIASHPNICVQEYRHTLHSLITSLPLVPQGRENQPPCTRGVRIPRIGVTDSHLRRGPALRLAGEEIVWTANCLAGMEVREGMQ